MSVGPDLPVTALIGMIQMLPRVTPSKLLNRRRRYVELFGPKGRRVLPPVPARVPILQDCQGILLGHPGMRRLLPLQPDVLPVPSAGFLNGPRQAGPSVSEAVVPDLIDGEIREFSGDFGVGIAFLRQITPNDNNRSSWFSHKYHGVRFEIFL